MKPVSVTQLNNYIARILATDPLLGELSVTGEVSNLNFHQSGHVFFSLKDANSKVDCFLPRSRVAAAEEALANGREVVAQGYIRVYEPRGTYSLQVTFVESAGEGDLAVAFAKMKDKLDKEGLFDLEHKKILPAFPKKVGLVTAATGAAVQDILRILRAKNDYVDIEIFPVPVQGEGAAERIAATIDVINDRHKDIDVLIVGRGGGSAEDLWAFNEEVLARSIFASEIPIISAVGHEIDFSISDFVADVRAATPTQAAELAVPDTGALREELAVLIGRMTRDMDGRVRENRHRLSSLDVKRQQEMILARIEREKTLAEGYKNRLTDLSPMKVLERGYALVQKEDGSFLKSVGETAAGNEITVKLADGELAAAVTGITPKKGA